MMPPVFFITSFINGDERFYVWAIEIRTLDFTFAFGEYRMHRPVYLAACHIQSAAPWIVIKVIKCAER